MRRLIPVLAVLPALAAPLLLTAQRQPTGVQHVDVYKESGRYGGWPANHGIWAWGNEILVGFEAGYFKGNQRGHAIDYTRPAEHLLARSLDGGVTWAIERPADLKPPPGALVAGVPAETGGRAVTDSPGGIPFTHPDFVFTARMASIHVGPSRFYYSTDRGKRWQGPFALPDFGQPGIAARTDYLVDGPSTLTIFLTAAKANKKEGRVLAARTTDGGKTWTRLGFVHDEPADSDYGIMPSSVRLSPTSLLTAVRFRRWIEVYRSDDNGASWKHLVRAVPDTGRGNPPSLVRLEDGRLVITYGYRAEPYGIRARISTDEGKTWDDDVVLRSDGGTWDLGYTRTVQRADGKLVTIYYYNVQDTERFIGATIWTP
ncbi:MAG: exo-alpha-sialidase [Acidobacteria bacterium]|nr:exo-alpha-sialidase [Acidobacteriota bacterium]